MPTPSTDHTRIQPHPAPPPNMPLKVHAGPKGHIHSHRRPPKRPHHHTLWVSKPLPVGNLTTAPPPPLIPEPMTAPPTAPARDNPLSHLKEQVGADHVLPAPTCSTPQGRITSTRKPQGTPPQHRKGHRRTHPITPLLPITPQQHRVKQEPPKSPRSRARATPPRRGQEGHPPPRPPQHLPPSCVRMPPTHDHPRVMPTRNTHTPTDNHHHIHPPTTTTPTQATTSHPNPLPP